MWDGWIPVSLSLARSEPQVQKLQTADKLSLQRSEAIALYISTYWRTDDRHTMFGNCHSNERGFKSWGGCRIYYYTHWRTHDTQCSETVTVMSEPLSREAVAVYIIIHTEEQKTNNVRRLVQFWARLKVFNEVKLLLYILLYTLKNRRHTMFGDCCSFERGFKPNNYSKDLLLSSHVFSTWTIQKKKPTSQDRDTLSAINSIRLDLISPFFPFLF